VAFTQQHLHRPSFVRSHMFAAQLLKHGMNAFAQSRARRLTSDRLLSKAVAMRRQTLGRAAIASGTDSFFSLLKSSVLPRVRFASVVWAPAYFFSFVFSSALRFLSARISDAVAAAEAAYPDVCARVRAIVCRCVVVVNTISICMNIIGIIMIIVTTTFAEPRLYGSLLERAGGCKRHCP
jgi:hypothetical protein